MTKALLAALPFVALAACVPVEQADEGESLREQMLQPDACGAEAYQSYVGQKSPAISVPAGTIVRHYRSGDPVTADFSPIRLNFEYDRSGVLVKVSCG